MILRLLLLSVALIPLVGCSLSQEELDLLADYRQRGAQYYDVNDLTRAEQQARRGLEIDPENGDLQHLLGRTLLKKGDTTSVQLARQHLEIAYDELDDFKTSYSLGEYHLRHAELLIGSAIILQGKISDLEGTSSTSISSMQDDIDSRQDKAHQHLVEALGFFDVALSERAEWVEALQHRASTLAHLHRDDEAIAGIEKLCQVLERSRQNKYSKLSTQQLDLAQETYWRNDLLRDIQWEVEARGLASGILMNSKRWPKAEEQLTAILMLSPDRANEYFNRGLARYFQGSLQGAAKDMRTFLGKTQLSAESEQVARALNILQEFEGQVIIPTSGEN